MRTKIIVLLLASHGILQGQKPILAHILPMILMPTGIDECSIN
jgi:hypothetical protein